MFKTILVPTDGSPSATTAAMAAINFARETGGKVVAISVAEPHPSPLLSDSDFFGTTHRFNEKSHDLAKEYVGAVELAARAADVPCETVAVHSFRPDEEIVNAAKKFNCDLIFMASHGRKGWTGLFAGAETQKVLAHAAISVLVFR
jgi:nucleotide-binding universal stress UspA family protein